MAVPVDVESRIKGAPVSAHLATTVEDRPHVAPVWYGYRDGVIYFMTGGKKLDNIRHNPRIALSIEAATESDVAWNVTLLGRATIREDPDRMDWASGWIYDKYNDTDEPTHDDDADPIDRDLQSDGGEAEYALVEVTVGSVAWNNYE